MSQVNVNTPQTPPEPRDDGSNAVAAGLNLITVLIILAVAIVIIAAVIWFFTGSGFFVNGGTPPAPSGGSKPVPTVVPQKTSDILGAVLGLI